MSSFTLFNVLSLETLTATEFNEIFSSRLPPQEVKVFRIFGNCSVCTAHSEDRDRVSSRISETKLHTSKRLSASRKFRLFNAVYKFLNSFSARPTSEEKAVSVAAIKRSNFQSMGTVQKAMIVRKLGSI